MKSRLFQILAAVVILSMAQMSCVTYSNLLASSSPTHTSVQATATQAPSTPAPVPTSVAFQAPLVTTNAPYRITGSFKWTQEDNGTLVDNILYSERQVVLTDLHGFVIRNKQWELPVDSQALGYVQYDPSSGTGKYELALPEIPDATFNNVGNKNPQDTGVQIFAVDYEPVIYGSPFETGDDRLLGWPTDDASIKVDSERDDEINGGTVIVWAPDDKQYFPTGFGADNKLFTADDPTAPLPAGYTVVNLDTSPFSFSQSPQQDITLYESPEAKPHDFSKESYTQAFDDLVSFLKTDYAFDGIQGKQPNWDQLVANIRPRVQQAQQSQDKYAFYEALRDFTYAFKDGHTGLDGGDLSATDFQTNYEASYGFTVRVLDDKSVLVDSVLSGGPAEAAGMKTGAIITQFNGEPVMDAINSEPLFFQLQSSDFAVTYEKAIMLTRAKPNDQASITFTNPGGSAQSVTLSSVVNQEEVNILKEQLGLTPTPTLLPVELQTLTVNGTDIGYIKVNKNFDDLNLLLKLFERGLQDFQQDKVAGLIIDLRDNGGGVPLGLAGFLTNQTIDLGQLEYYNKLTGKFEPQDQPDQILPKEQYHFDKIAVLVGLNCASACELEAYGFSKVPGAVVVGEYPTAGVEAEVSRGQIIMPEGINMQFPTGREVLPDGSLFLEGTGVQPALKVPVNATNVLSTGDAVLTTAENSILGQPGSSTPGSASTAPTPSATLQPAASAPTIDTISQSQQAASSGAPQLEQDATEQYQPSDFAKPGSLTYTVSLSSTDQVLWTYGWCATTTDILKTDLKNIQLKFTLDGQNVPESDFATDDSPQNGEQCHTLYVALSNWVVGRHHLVTTATFTSKINDGTSDYAAGDYVLDYTVNVQP
ncbi:MAG TPA: S41 family peptidase [Anaerolineales bacterium]|nr:S41 family peptidase [Anaerolineales bacterium]